MKFTLFVTIVILLSVNFCPAQKSEPLFAVTIDGQKGFIDATGRVVIKPQFIQCSYEIRFVDGLAVACTKDGSKAGFIDKTGKFIIKQNYDEARNFSEGLAAVQFGESGLHDSGDYKTGFIDQTGKIVIEPIFREAMDFSEGLAAVRRDGKSGFIDRAGKIVIALQYDYAFSFSEGLAAVYINGHYGFIDKTGRMVIKPQFTQAQSFSEGLACVRIGGKTVKPFPYITHQEIVTTGRTNHTYGYLNKQGQIIYTFAADDAGSFTDGLAAVETLNGYGFINKSGRFVIQPKYSNVFGTAPHFSEGLCLISLQNKIGFINKKGRIVIKAACSHASDFENGLAQFWEQTSDTCGYINKTGKVVWQYPQ